jgi:N-acyl-D-amino-acid deacylase
MSGQRILLVGGSVVGTSGLVHPADVLFDDEQILAIGEIPSCSSAKMVSVDDAIILPGFIDTHVHGETPLWEEGGITGAIAQGVTSVVLGQDGCSWAPSNRNSLTFMDDYFGAVNGVPAERSRDSFTVEEFIKDLEPRAIQNYAYLAPHGNLRLMVEPAAKTPLRGDALRDVGNELKRALDQGAIGLSSGFDYVPSAYGDSVELAELCKMLAPRNLPYVSHLRGYEETVRAGLRELIWVGAETGVRVHASHLRGNYEDVLSCIEEAEKQGVELTYDMYPYVPSSTTLLSFLLPVKEQRQGSSADEFLEILASPDIYRFLTDSEEVQVKLRRLKLSHVGAEEHRHLEGEFMAPAAESYGMTMVEFALFLLQESRLRVGVVNYDQGTEEQELEKLILDGRHCGGSDGIYQGRYPHQRGYGAYVKMLRSYINLGPHGLSVAVKHLASNPAALLGLKTRGSLSVGYSADVVVWRPGSWMENSTDSSPRSLASGAEKVYVNGVLVWNEGRLTGLRPGRGIIPECRA